MTECACASAADVRDEPLLEARLPGLRPAQGRAAFALAAVLALAGCGLPPHATPEQFCAAQANNDPTVRQLIIDGVSSPTGQEKTQLALADARRAATIACLKRQGIPEPAGGVEPVPKRDTLFP